MKVRRLKPKPLVIADDEGFENTDMFGLKEYGERLANMVCNVEDPLVTILDGPWGSGKTIFAKQWAGLMRSRGARVIYFDAFANDHYEDALIPLAAQILSALPDAKEVDKFRSATLEIGKFLLPVTADILIRASTAGILSLDNLQGTAKIVAETLSRKTGLIIEKTLEERLEAAGEENTIQKFREILQEVAEIPAKPDSGATLPLVFIVDELDRCRPIFSINLIERVKHLFSVPSVQFLMIAHLPQLEESVKHCYGLGFGERARIYLEKFYDVKMAIPEDRVNSRVDRYIQYLWKELEIDSAEDSRISQLKFLCFGNIARIKKISFRASEKILANIALAYSVMPRDPDLHVGFLIEGLCIIRHLDPELYGRICSGIVTNLYDVEHLLRFGDETSDTTWLSEMWNEVMEFFELKKWSGRPSVDDWVTNFWTYGDHRIRGDGRHLGIKVVHFARIIDSMSTT